VFRAVVPNAAALLKGKGNVFQRLDDTADLFARPDAPTYGRESGAETWQRLQEFWAARHVFTHTVRRRRGRAAMSAMWAGSRLVPAAAAARRNATASSPRARKSFSALVRGRTARWGLRAGRS